LTNSNPRSYTSLLIFRVHCIRCTCNYRLVATYTKSHTICLAGDREIGP
jgi:hypothetical protein